MSTIHSAEKFKLLVDGAPVHGDPTFKFDNISVRPSHIDRIVKGIYEDIEAVANTPGGATTYTNLTPTPQNFPANSPFDNIPTGSTFDGKTVTEMFDQMLYPELFPTLTNPDLSPVFALAQSGLHEVGAVIAQLDFTTNFSRGLINPAYTTNGFRSGLPNTYNYTGSGLTSAVLSTSLQDVQAVSSYTVLLSSQYWTAAVAYDVGQQPLSSKNNNYSTPLSAGNTTADSVSITGVYPAFATTQVISSVHKQALVTMSGYVTVSLVAETSAQQGVHQEVDIPTAWGTITTVEFFSTLNNQWGASALADWTQTAVTHEIPAGSGNMISYTKFKNNAGFPRGAGQYRFT